MTYIYYQTKNTAKKNKKTFSLKVKYSPTKVL